MARGALLWAYGVEGLDAISSSVKGGNYGYRA